MVEKKYSLQILQQKLKKNESKERLLTSILSGASEAGLRKTALAPGSDKTRTRVP